MGRGGFYGNDDQLDQCEKLASASLGSVLAPNAQHIHSILGQRPRIHRPKNASAECAIQFRYQFGRPAN